MSQINTIIKSISASTVDMAEAIEMAYELGISHGRSQLAEERKRPAKKWTWAESPASNIATYAKLKSGLEQRWLSYLVGRFYRVNYEPKRFPCFAEGKRTTYTPDFQCIPEKGDPIWIDSKSPEWRGFKGWNASSDGKQLKRMQSCVKQHRIRLYVCSGEPDDCEVYQILGLNTAQPDHAETLVKVSRPW